MSRDPEFQAEMRAEGIEADLAPGEAIAAMVARNSALPSEMAERIRKLAGTQ